MTGAESMTQSADNPKFKEFIEELSGFAGTAEAALSEIEQDPEAKKANFQQFADRMFAIRGTALQLGLPFVAQVAEMGEEIAVKGTGATGRAQVRKCVGALWDTLTTVKYLLIHHTEETSEEQQILMNRLQKTLEYLGGARQKASIDEIEELLKQRG